MPKLNISPDFKNGFDLIFKLSEEEKTKIINAIKESPTYSDPDALSKYVSSKTKIDEYNIGEFINIIFLLIKIKENNNDLMDDKLLEDVLNWVKEQKIKTTKNSKNDLKNLLSLEQKINYSRKLAGLSFDRQNILTDTRIITDIRPIFNLEKDKLKDSIIIHNFKIEYIENDEQKTIYFALDEGDLKKIKEDCIWAEKKAQEIKKIFKQSTSFIDLK